MIDQHEITRLRGEYHHEYDKSMKSFMQYICHVLESLIQFDTHIKICRTSLYCITCFSLYV